MNERTIRKGSHRWFRPTPGRFLAGLLVMEGLLWLSERFRWLPWHKGYAVLTSVAVVGGVLVLMLVWYLGALVFRARFQFSVRSLLVLTVAIALPCSWLAVEMKRAKEQEEAVRLIETCGGEVCIGDRTDYEGPVSAQLGPGGNFVPLVPSPVDHQGVLERLLGKCFFDAPMAVYLWKPNLSDVDPHFKYRDPEVAAAMLASFRRMPELRFLDLSSMPVSDPDLAGIAALKKLRHLDLRGTEVTDEGVENLQHALPNCQVVH